MQLAYYDKDQIELVINYNNLFWNANEYKYLNKYSPEKQELFTINMLHLIFKINIF